MSLPSQISHVCCQASHKTQTPQIPERSLLTPHEAEIIGRRWNEPAAIPAPDTYSLESEAVRFRGAGDYPNSPYFPAIDFYHQYSRGGLSILPCFQTYQQTRPYTCASAIALMTLCYWGDHRWKELDIADRMASFHGLPPDTRRPVPVKDLVRFFQEIGWHVESNLESAAKAPDDGKPYNPWSAKAAGARTFPELEDFADYCRKTLRSGTPILVENIDWGAHWRAIIGYDDLGTGDPAKGVLILADPHDTARHCQDGYVTEHIDHFYSTWYDIFVMERDECTQPFVTARPPYETHFPTALPPSL